jgi:DNA-binding GntR family transcriptional regulator
MAVQPDIRRPQTAAEAVANRLRTEIQRGQLAPGTPLRQNDIAQRFGVSTTPVREAFALLQADGIVQIDRYRGAVVFRPTPEDLADAYEIRELLETLALGKAVHKLNGARLDELEAQLDEMEATNEVERWMELNDAFHIGLYAPSASSRLLAAIASERDACSQYIRMHISDESRRAVKEQQHREILAACRANDLECAQDALRVHLRHSMGEILELIGASPRTDGSRS